MSWLKLYLDEKLWGMTAIEIVNDLCMGQYIEVTMEVYILMGISSGSTQSVSVSVWRFLHQERYKLS